MDVIAWATSAAVGKALQPDTNRPTLAACITADVKALGEHSWWCYTFDKYERYGSRCSALSKVLLGFRKLPAVRSSYFRLNPGWLGDPRCFYPCNLSMYIQVPSLPDPGLLELHDKPLIIPVHAVSPQDDPGMLGVLFKPYPGWHGVTPTGTGLSIITI